jgi:hypothetical protein
MRNQQKNEMSNQSTERATTITMDAQKVKETLKELEYEYMHGHKCNFMGAAFDEEHVKFEE